VCYKAIPPSHLLTFMKTTNCESSHYDFSSLLLPHRFKYSPHHRVLNLFFRHGDYVSLSKQNKAMKLSFIIYSHLGWSGVEVASEALRKNLFAKL
jgi:hypothetical protein